MAKSSHPNPLNLLLDFPSLISNEMGKLALYPPKYGHFTSASRFPIHIHNQPSSLKPILLRLYILCIAYKKKGYVVLSWYYVWSRGQENAMPCHYHATGVNVLSKMFPSFSTSKWSWLSKESAGLGLNERVLFCVFLIASRKFISLFLQTEEFGWML